VLLTGGECTINKDFLKVAEYIRKKHLMLTVLTNGQKLYDDEELFENFVSLYPSNVQISLYSMDAKIHDNLTTVKGSHYKTLNVIKKLKSRNINTNVSCFQTSYNPKSYIEVKKFTEELGVNFNTNCLFYYNPMNKNLNAKLKIKEIKDFYINTIDINNPRETEFACSGGMDRISVLPNLDVTPCNYCYYILGNYKKNSLENIRNTNVKVFQNTFKKENLKDCYKHSYCKYCINCARYHSYTQNGLLKKCNQLCIDAKMYEEALKFVRGIEG
jgi:MoaA/NifB/PqqE/SkfB family radical SAM enzyme